MPLAAEAVPDLQAHLRRPLGGVSLPGLALPDPPDPENVPVQPECDPTPVDVEDFARPSWALLTNQLAAV